MKYSVLLINILIIFLLKNSGYSQSVIFVCYNTGAVGVASGGYSLTELEKDAENLCIQNGGKNPVLLSSTYFSDGWCAVARGVDSEWKWHFGCVFGAVSSSEAERYAEYYLKQKGDFTEVEVKSWELTK